MKRIPLTKGKFTLVDDDNYEWLTKWSWYDCRGYAARGVRINGRTRHVRMHREIMKAPKGVNVDHINGKEWDNRRENLRFCNQSQNNANRASYKDGRELPKGVTKVKGCNRFSARIKKDYKNHYLGIFKTVEEAKVAYDTAAKELFGEFARA